LLSAVTDACLVCNIALKAVIAYSRYSKTQAAHRDYDPSPRDAQHIHGTAIRTNVHNSFHTTGILILVDGHISLNM
jgi:hypothetical protein